MNQVVGNMDVKVEAGTYSKYENFDTPIMVKGTNVVLSQNELLAVSEMQNHTVLSQAKEFEDRLKLWVVGPLSTLKVVHVSFDFILFRNGDRYFVLYFGVDGKENSAFKSLCKVIRIPYSFIRRNPEWLKQDTMLYWIDKTMFDKRESQRCYGLSFLDAKRDIEYVDASGSHITCTDVYPIIGLHLVDLMGEINKELVVDPYIPLGSRFVSRIMEHEGFKSFSPRLQSSVLTYTQENKGDFFFRFVFDRDDCQMDVGGERYSLGMTVSGNSTALTIEDPLIQFQMFRQVCSNGLCVYLDESKLKAAFPSLGDSEAFVLMCSRFRDGMRVSPSMFNKDFRFDEIVGVLETIVLNKKLFETAIASMYEAKDLSDNPELFVETVESLASTFKLSSQLTKVFLQEYVAGVLSGNNGFLTVIDVVNYLTFVSRSFDTEVVRDTETKAAKFAFELFALLAGKKEKRSSFDRIRDSLMIE